MLLVLYVFCMLEYFLILLSNYYYKLHCTTLAYCTVLVWLFYWIGNMTSSLKANWSISKIKKNKGTSLYLMTI